MLTKVTEQEIESHIDKKICEAHERLSALLKKSPILKNIKQIRPNKTANIPSIEKLQKELSQQFKTFCRKNNIIFVPITEVNPDQIFDRYFSHQAPFGEGKKKHEFPDVFAAAALSQWCEKNDEKIHVVTEDSDWVNICQEDPNLIYQSHLDAFLSLIPDPKIAEKIEKGIRRNETKVQEMISDSFCKLDFYSFEVDDLQYYDVRTYEIFLDHLYVVEAADGSAKVAIECTIDFEVAVSYEDPTTGIYDSEDKQMYFMETAEATIGDRISDIVEAQVDYHDSNPARITIKSVEFSRDEVEITLFPDDA